MWPFKKKAKIEQPSRDVKFVLETKSGKTYNWMGDYRKIRKFMSEIPYNRWIEVKIEKTNEVIFVWTYDILSMRIEELDD